MRPIVPVPPGSAPHHGPPPAAAVKRIQQAAAQALKEPAVRERLADCAKVALD